MLRTFWFLRYTGMRGGELLHLEWRFVYADRIELRSSREWKIKGRRDSVLPIAVRLQEFIATQDIQPHGAKTSRPMEHIRIWSQMVQEHITTQVSGQNHMVL